MDRAIDPLQTIDAKLWADEFMATKQRLGDAEFDHAMMLGWFANAIMRGYDEGKRLGAADAQATIAALQARLMTLKHHAGLDCGDNSCLYAENKTGMRTNGGCRCSPKRMKDDLERSRKACDNLQAQLTQRTAELEAANQRVLDERNLSNSWMKKHDELLAKVHKSGQFGAVVVQDVLKERDTLHAELERVRDQFADLRKMVAALPRVEGEVTVRDITALYWTSDGTYGSIDCKEQFVSLLKHRQGMEG